MSDKKQPVLKKYVDYSRCIGCESCEAICKFLHGTPRIQMTQTDEGLAFPLYCHHCTNPQCVKACPSGAITRDHNGVVLHNPSLCRGCRSMKCMDACPFMAMYHAGGVVPVTKCDLCAERRRKGLGPACEEVCPAEAIRLVTEEELKELRSSRSMAAQKLVMKQIRQMRGK
ncbi:4Fe-4S dicluster domain-containing protein [Desulfobaculum bizertense]|uniref:Fe-S-cluster-containing dehydrogenase component n=1 Tax=Desulfobaculum bizertense DSM 18034 TaxID=1121442 RepID=A0A1T4VWV4_9BACT|nr:4Fe-4S dicluster domain-containing protein [Desulfobaculum bizertense]UIJ36798.1 (Fe-S)-binding protein [Desulfobaculum bizertense]SKA69305.1 Fe-S-cluster-containing dehydrogenase component [Desulfobaculum bizertense DSM 18034]